MEYFPTIKYVSTKAVRHLMQLPVIVMEISSQKSASKLYVAELQPGIDSQKLRIIMRQFLLSNNANVKDNVQSKQKLNALCTLTTTEADRNLIKMAVCSKLWGI